MSGSKGGGSPYLIAIVVTLAAFMEVVDTTIVNVSLPYIAGDLGVSTDNAAWSLTTYLVANGITLTVSAALSKQLGRRRYFIISIAGFTAASFACGLSTSFVELLAFRALQGLFGGGLQPMQQDIVLDTFPPAQRQAALSITAVATIIAPVVGPLVGGYLTFNFSWHWIFLINVPIGALTIFGVLALVKDPPEMKKNVKNAPRFDWIGTIFIALALGCMELGADRGEDYDWLASNFIRLMLVLSVIGYVGGVTYLLYAKNPAVNLRVFKDRNFALSWYSMAMMGFALYASAIIMPLFSQNVLGYNSVLAGWVLAPGAVVLCVLIPIVSKILNVVPVKWVVASGGIALALSCYYSMTLVPDLDFFHVALYRAAQTAALSLLFVPLSSSAYSTIPSELKEDAASLFTMARNVYGGVGISVGTALVTDHLQIRQAHLVQNLDPTNQPYNALLQSVQHAAMSYGEAMQQAVASAPGEVFQMLQVQSSTLAYTDVFFVVGLMALSITAAGVFMTNVIPGAGGGGRRLSRWGAGAFSLLLLAGGCTVGPNFQPPHPPDVKTWQHAGAADPAIHLDTDPDPHWWAGFDDPVLTELIQTAIRQNLDVQEAVMRVIESRQNIVTARAAGLPTLAGTGSYMREQLGLKGILDARGAYSDLNTLANNAGSAGNISEVSAGRAAGDRLLDEATAPVNLFQYGLSASWELDLFGRVRRSVEQAKALAQAQAEAVNDALTSLESEVAQAYVQLRGAQALKKSQGVNIASAQDSLDLTLNRHATGLSTDLDVEQARTQLLHLQRQLPEYDKQEQQAIDRLDILIGRPPGTLDARLLQPAPLPGLPNAVGLGVPSTLARRRPDIRAVEAHLHAATASVGIAVASFYPDVSLTGNLGIRAVDASYLTRWASHFYSAGPSVSLPIFEGGRLTAGLRMARAQMAEAALSYRGTVLNALREVEDSLVAFRADRIERDRLAGVLASAEDTLHLASSLYVHGLSQYLQVLDAQRTVESVRQQLVQEDMVLDSDVVALYRALGGGWESPGTSSDAPKVPGAPPMVPAAADAVAAPQ